MFGLADSIQKLEQVYEFIYSRFFQVFFREGFKLPKNNKKSSS